MAKMDPRGSGVYETIRAEIDLAELVGQFADLKDQGDNLVCFCPLKEQSSSSPAFKIYGDTFCCYSCQTWGDVVNFWQRKHDFPSNWEAAQDLAARYSIELPRADPEARKCYEERRQKEEGWAEVARENHERLLGPAGDEARAYLENRGFAPEHWERFLLGVNKAGDRVTIPYWSGGQIHGEIRRAIESAEPKYLYPPADEFALGRRPLFMQESPKAKEYLLVEGFFDQLAAEAMGIRAIASGSAGFSGEQLADLLDMAARGASFGISRDKDVRGIECAQTMLERLYPYARLIPDLPGEGKDVADFYQAGGEADELRGLMDESKDAVELAIEELAAVKRVRDRMKLLKGTIVPCVLQIPDRSERGAVVKMVSAADGLNKDIVQDAITEVEGKLLIETPERPEEGIPEEEWAQLLEPGVLDRYVADVCEIKRVVGDKDKGVIKLLACDAFEAQLEPLPTGKPIGGPVMLTGESGRGKNFLADAAVCSLPEEWYLSFTAASATSFYYAAEMDPAFLKHRFVYPNEVEAIDAVVEFLRPMISQAKAKKYVTNKNSDGAFTFQEIDVEGPITGCIPTVRNKLDDQLQTRLLVVEIEDYEGRIGDHTKALSEQLAPGFIADPHGHLVPKWRAALRSLTQVRKVVIPFAGEEGFKFSNEDVKHGARLWGNLLGSCARTPG